MGIRDRIGKGVIRTGKRLTGTTYDSLGGIESFGSSRTNPYTNDTTWLKIYSQEPFIRGAIDALVNAVTQEWSIESVKLKPSKADEALRIKITNELSSPRNFFRTKLATMTYKLIIDSLFVLETSATDKQFYVLNKEDCTIVWNDRYTRIKAIQWKKISEISTANVEEVTLNEGEFVLGSIFDPDTNLWQNSPMETLISIANLLYHAREYNLDIFKNGGVPSMLYTLPLETTPDSKDDFKRQVKTIKSGENLIGIGDIKAQPIAGFTKDMEYNILVDHAIQSIMTLLGVSPLMMNLALKSGSGGGGEGTRQEMNAFATRVHTIQKIINDGMTLAIHQIHGVEVFEDEDEKPKVGRKREDPVSFLRFKLRKWVDTRQQAAMHKIYIDTGVINANEARVEIGKEPREGGNEYSNSNDRGAAGNTGELKPEGQNRDPAQEEDTNEGPNQNDGNRVEDKGLTFSLIDTCGVCDKALYNEGYYCGYCGTYGG